MICCVLCLPQGKYTLNMSSMKRTTCVCLMTYCRCPLWLQPQLAKPFPRCILSFASVQSMKAQPHFLPVSSSVSAAGSCWHLAAGQGSRLSTPLVNSLCQQRPTVSTWPVYQCSAKHQVKTEREVKGKPSTGFEPHSILRQTAGESSGENGIHHLWLDVGVAVEQ